MVEYDVRAQCSISVRVSRQICPKATHHVRAKQCENEGDISLTSTWLSKTCWFEEWMVMPVVRGNACVHNGETPFTPPSSTWPYFTGIRKSYKPQSFTVPPHPRKTCPKGGHGRAGEVVRPSRRATWRACRRHPPRAGAAACRPTCGCALSARPPRTL